MMNLAHGEDISDSAPDALYKRGTCDTKYSLVPLQVKGFWRPVKGHSSR